jgi:hypothetical protein
VHVVIIGFGAFDVPNKRIFDYGTNGQSVTVSPARNISPSLVEAGDITIVPRSRPLCNVPEIVFGNMPNDGGNLVLSDDERAELLDREPGAKKFIRPFVGAQEFINGERRWCLWLQDISPQELRAMPLVLERVERVRAHREQSKRRTTQELAARATLFGEIRQPNSDYLLIPSVSSENRRYIPIGFMPRRVIGSNLVLFVPQATHYHFGVLSSAMHMAWVRQICGRLESRIRYSNRLVYNNFPWRDSPTAKQRAAVETAARAVLEARQGYLAGGATLADLYDPLAMPLRLAKAHSAVDRAVDRCYRSQPFATDRQRIEHLFVLYEKLATPLISEPRRPRR